MFIDLREVRKVKQRLRLENTTATQRRHPIVAVAWPLQSMCQTVAILISDTLYHVKYLPLQTN